MASLRELQLLLLLVLGVWFAATAAEQIPHTANSWATSGPFDGERKAGDAGPPRRAAGLEEEEQDVEQVHLGVGGPGEALVTFVSRRADTRSQVYLSHGSGGSGGQSVLGEVSTYTMFICPTSGFLSHAQSGSTVLPDAELAALVDTSTLLPETGSAYVKLTDASQAWEKMKEGCVSYKNPQAFYQSPYIHTVVLRGLAPRTTYFYRPGGQLREFSFTTPPAAGAVDPSVPLRLGVFADVGTSNASRAVMKDMAQMKPELLMLAGDYSYADGWAPIWDLFGQLSEPLMSSVLTLGVPGDHEMAAGRSQGKDWMERYPVPYRAAGSESPLWYSYEAGQVHFLCLVGSYAPTGVDSAQYQFALQDLQRLDRKRTPWLVVQFHTPWYTSNQDHYKEAAKHQDDMEGLLFLHSADLVFSGHARSYERSHPVYKGKQHPCGPTHIVVGDAGSSEGSAVPWVQPAPVWSAFRKSGFGSGLLTIHNSTHADWQWRSVAGASEQRFETSDQITVIRDRSLCTSGGDDSGRGLPKVQQPATAGDGQAAARPSAALRKLVRVPTAARPPPQERAVQQGTAATMRAAAASAGAFAGPPQLRGDAGPAQPRGGVTRSLSRPPPSRALTHEEALALAAPFRGARRLAAAEGVEQVHLGFGGPGEVVVTFLSQTRGLASEVWYAEGTELPQDIGASSPRVEVATGSVAVYTTQICPSHHLETSLMGPPHHPLPTEDLAALVNTSSLLPPSSVSYVWLQSPDEAWDQLELACIPYKNPLAFHQSPYIHTVVLKGLEPRTKYTYQPKASSRSYSFTSPPDAGGVPSGTRFKLGVWADVGTTNISFMVMQELKNLEPDALVLVGDFSYADGWSQRWDTFGTMMEPLMASVPTLGVAGNHEVASSGKYQGLDWTHRYPVPFREAGSKSPMWYSKDVGPIHILGLAGSYAPTGENSPQYLFAAADLAKVDRAKTPWVVVLFHTPWYNSNRHHYQEGEKHRHDMEHLLYSYGVDLVFSGHVHSYERSHPVYRERVDACGPVHIVIGDAGNYEGPAVPWVEPQPSWSALRESSFGAGLLTVHNSTHAEWEWHRAACVSKTHSYWTWDGADPLNCSTEGDNSQQRLQRSDRVMLERDVVSCSLEGLVQKERFELEGRGHAGVWWTTLVVLTTSTLLLAAMLTSLFRRKGRRAGYQIHLEEKLSGVFAEPPGALGPHLAGQ